MNSSSQSLTSIFGRRRAPGLHALRLILCAVALALPSIVPATTLQRQPNSTLRMPDSDPSSGSYRSEDAFPTVQFRNPVALASAPNSSTRLFIVERAGRILMIDDWVNPSPVPFLDITSRVNSNYGSEGAEGLTSIAFHPQFPSTPYFYVAYSTVTTTDAGSGRHNRLSRFTVSSSSPWQVRADSEQPLITQFDEGYGHNVNDLQFGPDGYLYVAIGDEGESQDQWQNSWRLDKDFFSAVLRIDVDRHPASLPPNPHPAAHPSTYAIPADNPFVGLTEYQGVPLDPARVRTEFYAIGFRNPWRIAFDPATGDLYLGDVGQHLTEEIDLVTKGGNYGWSFYEGTGPGFRGTPPQGYSSLPPLHEYRHGFGPAEGSSVTGGLVYRGQRIPSLAGAYVFADYASGHVWALRRNGSQPTLERLADDPGIAGFGIDPRNGDVLMADHDQGKIKRLIQLETSDTNLPPTLAETGAFSNAASLVPAAGFVPYAVNVPFWSDQAGKQRWFYIPTEKTVRFDPDSNWTTPPGSVWVKHFDLELTHGVPASARRIETRLLVRTTTGVYGVTYRWDENQQNAGLVPAAGLDQSFVIQENGVTRTQIWHFPSRTECLTCHTEQGGWALSFNTAQLNREARVTLNSVENQIQALDEAGFFENDVPPPHLLRALAPADDARFSREFRVRSYLAANCAQCHQSGGSGNGSWDARIATPTSAAGLIHGLLANDGGDPQNRLVLPGEPSRSMLLTRISKLGPGRMPPLGSNLRDEAAMQLLADWISNDLADHLTFAEWQLQFFGSTSADRAQPGADPDGDRSSNQHEYFLGTHPLDAADVWKIEVQRNGRDALIRFPALANRGFQLQSAPALHPGTLWQTLSNPANRPFLFRSADEATAILEPALNEQSYFRVRIIEP